MLGKILAITATAVLLAGPAMGQAKPPVKIGAFVAVTGQAAFMGEAAKLAMEVFVTHKNRAGGIDGRQIKLTLYDSKSSAKDATALVRRLIDQDEVDFLIGGNTTGETMAVVPFVEEAKIPFISLAGASVVIDPVKKYVFKTVHTDEMAIAKIYATLNKAGTVKLALLAGAGGYDQSCSKNARDFAPKSGIRLVADEQHGAGDSDVTAQLTNIRSSGAEAILYCGFGAPTSIVARNYQQLGLKAPLYMTHGAASRAYIKATGDAAEGTRVTGPAILAFQDMATNDPLYPVTRQFLTAFRAATKEDPSTFEGYAYDAMLLASAAITKAGSTDKDRVRDALEGLTGVAGISGIYNFSATDHLGFTPDSLRILVVRGGEFRLAE
jgi:branched-chain amino acid transport system substrate-binding protein